MVTYEKKKNEFLTGSRKKNGHSGERGGRGTNKPGKSTMVYKIHGGKNPKKEKGEKRGGNGFFPVTRN